MAVSIVSNNDAKSFGIYYIAKIAAMPVKISEKTILKIGPIVQFHRKRAGLSRIDLATIAGVGKTAVYDVEKAKETVRLNTLFKVLAALNIAVSLDSPLMDRCEADDDAQS